MADALGPRLLFVQPSFQPPGGGNGVAAWMLQALQDRYRITTLSWRPLDVGAINAFWGTSISSAGIDARHLPAALTRPIDRLPLSLALLRNSLLMRAARRAAPGHDVFVTANNELDVGRRCVQYIHYPAYLRPRPRADIRWYHHPELMLDVYYALADRLSGVSHDRIRGNIALANSDWTAQRYRERHGVTPLTVYPPISEDFPESPWDARDDTFMAIGRFSPEKDLEKVIDILAAVRREAPGVRLLLIGSRDNKSYYRRVMRRVAREAAWVSVREDLSRAELVREIARHRYGIHGMVDEHFGMAPAEMLMAGAVVFVASEGGQREVVGGEERLLYADRDDAVQKIVRVLGSEAEQADLRRRLAAHRERFTTRRFIDQIREVVAGACRAG